MPEHTDSPAKTGTRYADVILPLSLPGLFTYSVPDEYLNRAVPGIRVKVPVGSRKLYTGIIHSLHHKKPKGCTIKPIHSCTDETPVVNEFQLKLWDWISGYYMCPPGDVYRAAVPSGFKKDSFTPKQTAFIRLHKTWTREAKLNELLDRLSKAPRQHQLLIRYLDISGFDGGKSPSWIEKAILQKAIPGSGAVLDSLLKKGILESEYRTVSRLEDTETALQESVNLNDAQQQALKEINEHFRTREVVLLHGVTSSGKTELYIRLIRETLDAGRQVLYLLPEIALTTQIVARLKAVFGNLVGVYHSRYSDNARMETWNKLSGTDPSGNPPFQIILGARSAVFLPFTKLGLVIADEEHENSYKQYDPAPRYHARDTAILLAHLHHARVLLGSATPSLESYYNCITGKYALVELNRRYTDIQPPEIQLVNIREAYRKKQMKSHFSLTLLEAIEEVLNRKEQVILFQNRRGFALFLTCGDCGWIPRCSHCDVSLTYHKSKKELVCHYCGHAVSVFKSCGDCGSHNLQMRGFGTEKVEDEIQLLFPGVRVARLDIDTARSRKSFERVIRRFEQGQLDILVGTQMISKGLDFDNVSLVGILNADTMMNFPEFRAHERSFQLMMQVSGRAGRRHKQGRVIIQAYDGSDPLYHYLQLHDFKNYAKLQLAERKTFYYPPYTRLIEIILKHKQRAILDNASADLAGMLKKQLDEWVMGPEDPLISRIQNYHLKKILLKTGKDKSIAEVKTWITQCISEIHSNAAYKSLQVAVDVDPV